MTKIVTVETLGLFKSKQDAANADIFMGTADFVDGEGKIKAEKIPAQTTVSNVIPMHVLSSNSQTKYYTDNNGEITSTEVTGESGKIYIDLDSGSKSMYTYDKTSGEFVLFAAAVATSADIDSLFD